MMRLMTQTISEKAIKADYLPHFVVALGTFGVFLAALLIPGDLNLILAFTLSANFLIMGWALIKLYRVGLLLSPATAFLATSIPLYSFGNIGAVSGTDGVIWLHAGAVEYYPTAGILSGLGLLVYVWTFFRLLRVSGTSRPAPADVAPLVSLVRRGVTAWSIAWTSALALGVPYYLSWKHDFVSGYFVGLEFQFDRLLAGSVYSFIFLASTLAMCGAVTSKWQQSGLIGIVSITTILLTVAMMRSRASMLYLLICMGAVTLTLRPERLKIILLTGLVLGLTIFAAGTVVKTASGSGIDTTTSLRGNLEAIVSTPVNRLLSELRRTLVLESPRRMAGLELPATILMADARGAPLLWARGLGSAVIGFLPFALRPEGDFSERTAIENHYRRYGMVIADVSGTMVSSGLAMGYWGIVPIYALLAGWHALIWCIARSSGLLFLSYLATLPTFIRVDLMWDSSLYSVRTWLAMVVIIWLLRPIIMARTGGSSVKVNTRIGASL